LGTPSLTIQNPARGRLPGAPRPARNVLSNWFTYLVSGVVSFFLSPFIIKHLGNSAYGVWVLLVSLTGYLGFLDLGIRGAVTRYIAKFHAQGDHDEASRTVSSACGLFLIAGLIAMLASVVFSIMAVPYFHIPPAYERAARIVVVIAGLNVAVSLISGVFGGIVVGLQRFTLLNAIALGMMALRSIAIVVALRGGRGLITLALIQFGATVGEFLFGFTFSRKLYPEVHIALSSFQRRHVSQIFSFGLYAFLLQLSNYLIFYSDALVIGAFLSVAMVTFFAIGGNLTIYARDLVGGVSRTMTPLASRLEVEDSPEKLQETVLKAARYCSIVLLPIVITFIIRGKSFIGLWMGPSYSELSGHVLWILSIPWLFGAGTSVVLSAILGIGRHKPVVPSALAESFSNLALSIILVKSMGIVGVAWGTAIPNLAISLFFWPWYIRRTMGIRLGRYVLSLWILPLLASLPFAVLTYLIEKLWPAPNLFFFFVQVTCVLPAMVLGFWLFGSTAEERAAHCRWLAEPFARVMKRT
jgi:O-antigen/teichoic acid export membrane protein